VSARKEFLPFSKPSITEDDIAAVGDVLRSGWITTGPKAAEFEEKFREYTGCGGAVALSSATGGMHIALKALGIGPGDEVITPSMTWVSTPNLIVLAGATPVFAEAVHRVTDCFDRVIRTPRDELLPIHADGSGHGVLRTKS